MQHFEPVKPDVGVSEQPGHMYGEGIISLSLGANLVDCAPLAQDVAESSTVADFEGEGARGDLDHNLALQRVTKEVTKQREQERAAAGKDLTQLTSEEAERELGALERSYRQPGATSRSVKRKAQDLERFRRLLTRVDGTPLEKSMRQGSFDELMRTPSKTAGKPQTKFVAGIEEQPGMELRPGRARYAQPDYSVYRRRADGSFEKLRVNLKSDNLRVLSLSGARARANQYLEQAVRNSGHLAEGDSVVLSFAQTPSREIQAEMNSVFFGKGSPITEVRFGTTTHTNPNITPSKPGSLTSLAGSSGMASAKGPAAKTTSASEEHGMSGGAPAAKKSGVSEGGSSIAPKASPVSAEPGHQPTSPAKAGEAPPSLVAESGGRPGVKGTAIEEGAAERAVTGLGRPSFTLKGFIVQALIWAMIDYILGQLDEKIERAAVKELMAANVEPRIKQRLAELDDEAQRLTMKDPFATVYANVTINVDVHGTEDELGGKSEDIRNITFSDMKVSLKPEQDSKRGEEVDTFRSPFTGQRFYKFTRVETYPLPLQFPETADQLESRQLRFTAEKLVELGIPARRFAEAMTSWSEEKTNRFVEVYIEVSTGQHHDDAVKYLEEISKRPSGWRSAQALRELLAPPQSIPPNGPTIERARL
jgi:hypothetical protein